ncbi:unnamed protein product, partial [Meganyctiphanes norvegica]
MAIQINKDLLPVKAHYFLKFAGLAMTSFLPVIVRQKGVPTEGVGMMWSFLPVVNISSIILISYAADKFKAHRRFFLAGLSIMLLGLIAICFTPNIYSIESQMEICDPSDDIHENFNNSSDNSEKKYSVNVKRQICNLYSVCKNNSVINFECLGNDENRDLCLPNKTVILDNNSTLNCYFYVKENETLINKGDIDILNVTESYELQCSSDLCSIVSPNMHSFSLPKDIKCQDDYTFSFETKCSEEGFLQSAETKNKATMADTVMHVEFWLILVSLVLTYGGNHVSINLVDTATFQILGSDSHKYGSQRLFGTMGWGLMALAYGTVIDFFSKGLPQRDYTSGFILAFIMFMLSIISGALIKFVIEKKDEKTEGTMGNVLGNYQVILFL